MKKKANKKFFVVSIALLVFVLDQLSKFVVSKNMSLGQSFPVIKNIFNMTYVQNTGAAFSILRGQQWFFIIFACIVLLGIVFFWKRIPKENMALIPIALIVGGTLGNLIDRLRIGYVIDFLDFRIWPTFNIADSAITIGTVMLVFYVWKK